VLRVLWRPEGWQSVFCRLEHMALIERRLSDKVEAVASEVA